MKAIGSKHREEGLLVNNPVFLNRINDLSTHHNAEEAIQQLNKTLQTLNISATKSFAKPAPRGQQKLLAGLFMRVGDFSKASLVLSRESSSTPIPAVDVAIVDPGFSHIEGHHYHSNLFFSRLTSSLEQTSAVLRMQAMPGALEKDATHSLSAFTIGPYENGFFPALDTAEQTVLFNEFFYQEFSKVLPETKASLYIAHTVKQNYFEALCRYLHDALHEAPRSLILGFMAPDLADDDRNALESTERMYREGFKHLRDIPNLKILAFCETPSVAKRLKELSGFDLDINIAPYIATFLDETNTPPTDSPTTTPTLGYVGQSRPERGSLLMHKIARKTLSNHPNGIRWRMQLNANVLKNNLPNEDIDTQLTELNRMKGFEFVDRNLPTEDYYCLLDSIDIMVLPYHSRYNTSGSGVADESLKYGHVLVMPSGSHMARVAEKYQAGYVCFDTLSVESVNTAIEAALDNYAALKSRAVIAAQKIRQDDATLLSKMKKLYSKS